MNKLRKKDYANPASILLSSDPNEIKVSSGTIVSSQDVEKLTGNPDIEDFGRPDLSLSQEDIDRKIETQEKENHRKICENFQLGKYDSEMRDYLLEYYCNIKKLTKQTIDTLEHFFGSAPKSIKYINLTNGKVDDETLYLREHISYNTSMVCEFEIDAPWRLENQIPNEPMQRITIQAIIPQQKSLARAIEKGRKGGKYDIEQREELAKILPGQTIESAHLDKAKLRPPLQKLKDIMRITILAPAYDDVEALYHYGIDHGLAQKSSRPSKYLDNDPKNAQAFFNNSKNYRDCKNYWLLGKDPNNNNLYCEVLYKIRTQFYKGDVYTHIKYEEGRKNKQKFYEVLTEGDKLLCNEKIFKDYLDIKIINSKSFELCNLEALYSVRLMEDKLKKQNVQPDEKGGYELCRQLIAKRMLIRSSMAKMKDSFKDYPAWAKKLYLQYKDEIDKKYLVDIQKDEDRKHFFKDDIYLR